MKIPIRQYFALLRTYLRPQWRWVLVLAGLLLLTIGLRLVNPQILRSFLDVATSGGDGGTLVRAALLFFGLALTGQALSVAAAYVGETVAWSATNALRLDLLRHALELDATFHREHSPGHMIERIDGDVATLSNFFSRFAIDVLGNGVLVLGVLSLLFLEDWRIGAPIGLFTVLTLTLLVWIRKLAAPYWTKFREFTAKFYGFLGEGISATEDVRANGGEDYVMARFFRFVRRLFPAMRRSNLGGYGMWVGYVALFTVGNAIAFGVGASLWRATAITIGTVYLVFHYTELLRNPISEIRNQITDLQSAEAGIRRIRRLLDTESKVRDRGTQTLPAGPLAIEMRAVSFTYERGGSARASETEAEDADATGADLEADAESTDVPALSGISVELKPERVLGLLGRTGSGKTTLARLLVRLYDREHGDIRIGGHPIEAVSLRSLRRAVRLVPQEVQLFRASVRDNVRLFDPAVNDAVIRDALDRLGLDEWLAGLPVGLDTMLEARGGGLSAGQGQLLALARAFLADPGLVILDEASSRLDPATEALLEVAVDRLLEERTAIIIAHRLSTVERADRILILDDGRIAEFGPRADLVSDPASRLSRLLQAGMEEVLV